MSLLITEKSKDYELLDSGNGEKLEKFGEKILRRPDPQAIWDKKLSIKDWERADAVFTHSNRWKRNESMEDKWNISFGSFDFSLSLLPSKHVGLFPEQLSNWQWLKEKIEIKVNSGRKVSVLNLFANTGGATLACSFAGAEVVHLDSSKFIVDIAKKNLLNSRLSDKKVRFIVDDARKFVEREIKRKSKYDIIILDPPVYGKGSKKEVWKIEEDLPLLLSRLKLLLSPEPTAVLLNGYSSIYSPKTYENMLSSVFTSYSKIESGELGIKESSSQRILSSGIFAKIEF